ncbi:MAG: hypothetical protein IT328_16070 [Caldilineaceae bacterium]|nr:hypothetical protein [Caldilineaceae bacterium]
MTTRSITERTMIYRKATDGEHAIGFLDNAGIVYKLRWDEGMRVGRVTPDRRVFRDTRYDERELGSFTEDGLIHSHGLFEGGELGWVEPDGAVIQAGLIFGEEEIGRVEGEAQEAAGAALLLLFLPDEQEETNRANR